MRRFLYIVFGFIFLGTNCSRQIKGSLNKPEPYAGYYLRKAIRQDNRKRVKSILQSGVNINKAFQKKCSYFWVEGVFEKKLRSPSPGLGFNALHTAVRWNRYAIVEILLKNKADIHRPVQFRFNHSNFLGFIRRLGYYGYAPLHLAAELNNLPMVILLLKNGARINQIIKAYPPKGTYKHAMAIHINRETALHQACRHNNLRMVKYLVAKGAAVNPKPGSDFTPLMHTTDLKIIHFLIDKGANPYYEGHATFTVFETLLTADPQKSLSLLSLIKRKAGRFLKSSDHQRNWPEYIKEVRKRLLRRLKR